ncbi:hypothetical protein [Marixanthomonas spongiae]|uniref:Tetratricopeptide repeat protein n=1 Tax=Marixanthomonas spongiae TaxID=2174845 RepID=A0A2U0I3N9_9FLAO|nr:hypothetical protein [Marixanthomonas spongiae]PVW15709.1 hypothetical protein DDV96_05410 [Marixanthomonas spongiae]
MKKLLMISVLFISALGFSQTKYETGMQKAFELWQANKPWEAANLFERIAQAEPDKWLPPYYVAQINVIKSFGEKDKAKLTAQLKKAQEYINWAKTNSKENPEILILEAQWYTVWIVFDGQQYGMKYSAKVQKLYQEALQLAPNNPRVILSKAEWDIGGAAYFNQPLDPYCKDIKRAIELFATFKPEGKFYPSYGKERAEKLIKENCNQ